MWGCQSLLGKKDQTGRGLADYCGQKGPNMWNELGRQTEAGINSAIKTANSLSEARALYRALRRG